MRLRPTDSIFLVLYALVAVWACQVAGVGRLGLLLDNQSYYFISERVASGVAPHVSQFDPKNALSMFATGLAIALGRLVGLDDVLAARVISVMVVATVLPLVWVVAYRLTSSRIAAHVSVLACTVFRGFFLLAAQGARPKVFLVLAVLWTLWCAAGRRYFWLGVAGVACFLVWQPALLVLGAAAVVEALGTDRRRALPRMALGAACALAAYEAYFLYHGALAEQLYQSLIFPTEHDKPGWPLSFLIPRVFALDEAFGGRRVVMVTFALAGLVSWAAILARPRVALARFRERPVAAHVFVGAHLATAFTLFDYQGYPDRLYVLPYAALGAGALVGWAFQLVERRLVEPWASVAMGLAGVLVAVALVDAQPRPRYPYGLAHQRRAAGWVGIQLDRGRTVYAIGCPHLLALNRVDNYTPYGYFAWRIRAHFVRRMRSEGLWKRLRDGKLPDIVLDSRRTFAPNTAWLQRNYERFDQHLFVRQGIRTWRLRSLPYDEELDRLTRPVPAAAPAAVPSEAGETSTLIEPQSLSPATSKAW